MFFINLLKSLRSFFTYHYVLRFTLIFSIFNIFFTYYNSLGLLFYFLSIINTYFIVKVFQINKYLYLFVTFVLIFLVFPAFYLEYVLHIEVNSEFFVVMFQHIANSKNHYIFFGTIFILLVAILFWVYTVLPLFYSKNYFYKITGLFPKFLSKKMFIIALIFFYIGIHPQKTISLLRFNPIKFYPHQIYYHLKYYIQYLYPIMQQKGLRTNLSSSLQNRKIDQKPLNIVFYMGESARGDFFGINNYKKNTTPFLDSFSLINFGLIKSCSTLTLKSVPCVLTHYDLYGQKLFNKIILEKSFLEILGEFNFNTAFVGLNDAQPLNWYLSQSTPNVIYTNLFANFVETYQPKWDYPVDKDVDLGFKEYLKSYHKKNKKNIILIRNLGSHFPYNKAYPEKYAHFKPYCSEKEVACTREATVNTYNNTIYYTSHLIKNIINDLKKTNENSVFFYTSDHGESFWENGYLYHPNSSLENYTVPLFIWVSEGFKKNYPKEYQNLLKSQKKGFSRVDHRVIWHSIIDLAGLENKTGSHYLNLKNSLFNSQFEPPLDEDWRENFDSEKYQVE